MSTIKRKSWRKYRLMISEASRLRKRRPIWSKHDRISDLRWKLRRKLWPRAIVLNVREQPSVVLSVVRTVVQVFLNVLQVVSERVSLHLVQLQMLHSSWRALSQWAAKVAVNEHPVTRNVGDLKLKSDWLRLKLRSSLMISDRSKVVNCCQSSKRKKTKRNAEMRNSKWLISHKYQI